MPQKQSLSHLNNANKKQEKNKIRTDEKMVVQQSE